MSLQKRTQDALARVTASSMSQFISKGVARSTLEGTQIVPVLPYINTKEKTIEQRRSITLYGIFLIMLSASVSPDCTDKEAICLVLSMYINLFGYGVVLPPTYKTKTITGDTMVLVAAAVNSAGQFAHRYKEYLYDADSKGTEAERDEASYVSEGQFPALDTMFTYMAQICDSLGLPYPLYYPRASVIALFGKSIILELAGVLGLLVYGVGKRLTPKNVESFDHKRFQNIIDRYMKMDKSDPNPLTGALAGPARPRQSLYPIIFRAFGNDAAARRYIIQGMISLFAETETIAAGAAATPFRLLRYTGMSSYPIIANFLNTYEYAYTMAGLKGGIAHFTASCIHLGTISEEMRPYFKLDRGDRTNIFHRPDMTHLINVATAIMADDYESLRSFEHDDGDVLIDMFKEIRALNERQERKLLEGKDEEEEQLDPDQEGWFD